MSLSRNVRRRLALYGGAALVAAAAFHVTLAQGQVELDQLRDEAAAQEERYERLRVEVATQSAPDVIRQRAAALGLVEPDEVIHVSPLPGSPEVTSETSSSTTTATGNWPTVKPHLGDQP